MYIRITSFFAVLLSFFFLPWWLVCVCVLLYMVYFKESYEALVFGFFADGLYQTPYVYTLSCLVFYVINHFVQSRLRL